MAQWLARKAHNLKAGGSRPLDATFYFIMISTQLKQNQVLLTFLQEAKKCDSQLTIEGDYLDDNYFQFKFDYKTKIFQLNYFFYCYDEITLLCKDDYFKKNFPEEAKSPVSEEFSVSFEMSSQFINDILIKKMESKFKNIKEDFYFFAIRTVFKLLQAQKIKKHIISLNKNDFLCMTTENKLLSCFFIQQNINNSEKYYY